MLKLNVAKSLVFFIAIFCVTKLKAQNTGVASPVNKLIQQATDYYNKLPSEKLFLQLDKPYYTAADTLWFKTWLLKSANYQASQSIKLYVDLLNDSNRVVDKMVIPIQDGLGQGDFKLDNNLADGGYTIRAYTNWMQNFGEGAFFYKHFFIGNHLAKTNWLVSEQHSIKTTTGGRELNLTLQLKDLDNMAIPYRDIELRVMDKKKNIIRKQLLTSPDGAVNMTFILPEQVDDKTLTLSIIDKTAKNSSKISFPFYPGGPAQNIDIQFMPEGGSMVTGLYGKIAFKAIGDDGLGLPVSGTIVNSKNEEVAAFKTLQNGMGNFMLLPQAGEKYTAKYKADGGTEKKADLPLAKTSGVILRVDNVSGADSVLVKLTVTPDIAATHPLYNLIAQSKDVVHMGTAINLAKGFSNFRISKSIFPTGIVSFILLDDKDLPVNGRRIFIDKNDRLALDIKSSRPRYLPKDSIEVTLNVRDKAGKPVMGNFTVSVTDNALIKDQSDENNLVSHMLLTSEIKGNVETPGRYFTANDADAKRALDNLLLTQGWTGYDWNIIPPAKDQKIFEAEVSNHLSGKLLGLFNKPIKNNPVNMFANSKKYGLILLDTISNDEGMFNFRDLPLVDTIAYMVKALNKKGGEIGANIVLNEFKASPITYDNRLRPMPWFVHGSDSLMIKYFKRPNQPVLPGLNPADVKGKLLNEVVIKSNKPAVQIGGFIGGLIGEIDEKDLLTQGKKSLMDLLRQKFPGIVELRFYSDDVFKKPALHKSLNYCFRGMVIKDVYVDGQSAFSIYDPANTGIATSYYDYLKMFFNYLGADDIKSLKFAQGFENFMVITTRSGNGVLTRTSPGTMPYRPLPMYLPRKFYSPRYAVKNSTLQTNDNRTTIYWEPNLVTDSTGKATLSFYAADQPSSYTVTISGTDMNGSFGSQTLKIPIASKPTASK